MRGRLGVMLGFVGVFSSGLIASPASAECPQNANKYLECYQACAAPGTQAFDSGVAACHRSSPGDSGKCVADLTVKIQKDCDLKCKSGLVQAPRAIEVPVIPPTVHSDGPAPTTPAANTHLTFDASGCRG
jgi:hypothetical protein